MTVIEGAVIEFEERMMAVILEMIIFFLVFSRGNRKNIVNTELYTMESNHHVEHSSF